MGPKILITGPIMEKGLKLLQQYFEIEGNLEKSMTKKEILDSVADKVAIVTTTGTSIDKEIFDKGKNLRAVSTVSVGYDHIDLEEATKHGVYVTHTPHVLTESTAVYAIGLMLSVFRRINEFDRYVRAGKWNKGFTISENLSFDLQGKVLGIIGLGRIGKRVAEIAKTFGLKIIYYDIVLPDYATSLGAEYRDLDSLLAEADIVSLHCSLNPTSYHLINEEALNKMKKTAVLINTSRGPVVDEKALIKALKEGKIAGAGLDVFEKEPLPSDSELLKLENVVLSPHRASSGYETRTAMSVLAANNLISVLKGQMPPALVNKEVLNVRPLKDIKIL
ncbi:MAG: 2-hydroxyacid dehydrogenase [Nitrososphaeria archaeon]